MYDKYMNTSSNTLNTLHFVMNTTIATVTSKVLCGADSCSMVE